MFAIDVMLSPTRNNKLSIGNTEICFIKLLLLISDNDYWILKINHHKPATFIFDVYMVSVKEDITNDYIVTYLCLQDNNTADGHLCL